MIDFESQAARTLLDSAGRRHGIDVARCEISFAQLSAAERLRGHLRGALARHRLTDLQFALLVLLRAGDAEPIPMAVLARGAGVSRTAVTDAFDLLEASGLAQHARDGRDRRIIRGRITANGRQRIDLAIDDYLRVITPPPPPRDRNASLSRP